VPDTYYDNYVKFCERLGVEPAPRDFWQETSEYLLNAHGLRDKGAKKSAAIPSESRRKTNA
jgi:hypothetical protein